jgi:crotonobetainyl-CoA:carnitine CoA-transferase CaiB-like acyl-CoA transferase
VTSVLNGSVRVLDLAMGWAGPLVGQMFAEMGAEVIKVEDTLHFDWWRGSLSIAPPEMQPIERSAPFNTANRGKIGITLDLTNPRGVDLVKRLVAVSDIVVENYSPGVMDRFGLDYTTLAAINPRLIMISMPSFGSSGPECDARGYGNTVEAMAGITSTNGYDPDGQRYTLSNALGDPVAGLNGVFALMVALRERARTGRGQLVELAQVESVIPFLAEPIIEWQTTRNVRKPRGNRHPTHAPHGIFKCAGDEAWIAIACESDRDWAALAGAIGRHQLTSDPRFSSAQLRKRNEDALESELSAAFGSIDLDDALARLRDAGLIAAQVNSAAAILGDAQLAAREFYVPVDRAVVGTHLYPGGVTRMSATPLDSSQPAPLLGEHNRKVFSELLKLSDAEIARLQNDGIIGSAPRA